MSRNGGPWIEMTDRSMADLRRKIAERFQYQTESRGPSPLHFGEALWKLWSDALLYRRECDPFRDWLDRLPTWDGLDRTRHWLSDVFEVANEGNPLVGWASQFVFLGSVTRAYEPGNKLDEMPVLIGPQGIGKSTALRCTLPLDRPEWFADGLHLAGSPKERAESLQGRVIVEAAEMAGSTRAELESLKAFLSRTDDGAVRLAYRRNPETMLRRCIIVGTTNAPDPLPNDPSGNRRFVPVMLGPAKPHCSPSCDFAPRHPPNVEDDGSALCPVCAAVVLASAAWVRDYLDRNRAQLWAEAVWLYKRGVSARLPDELKTVQGEATERARRRDELLEDAVECWLAECHDGFTMAELARGIGLVHKDAAATTLSDRDTRRLGAVLRAQGVAKRRERRDGRLVTMWRKCSP